MFLFFFCFFETGEEVEQVRTSALPRGGRDAQGITAPQHCTLLRLLGGGADQAQIHRPRDGAYDVRDPQNVRYSTRSFCEMNVCLRILLVFVV